jgi:hypothetical protein
VRGPRILAVVVALAATTTITPAVDAHWDRCAWADGYLLYSAYDRFHLCAGHDGQAAWASLAVDVQYMGFRALGTYVVSDLFGDFVEDKDYVVHYTVQSAAYGNLVAAQFRFRSGFNDYCTRWDFDPWNGYRQNWTGRRCPEDFWIVPPELRPVSDLVIK